jgi:hypothetical protein
MWSRSLFGTSLDLYDANVTISGLGQYFPYRPVAPGQGIVALVAKFSIPGGNTANQSNNLPFISTRSRALLPSPHPCGRSIALRHDVVTNVD